MTRTEEQTLRNVVQGIVLLGQKLEELTERLDTLVASIPAESCVHNFSRQQLLDMLDSINNVTIPGGAS